MLMMSLLLMSQFPSILCLFQNPPNPPYLLTALVVAICVFRAKGCAKIEEFYCEIMYVLQ